MAGSIAAVAARSAAIVERLRAGRVLPVVTLDDATAADGVTKALLDGGISCLEITFRRPGAADAIRAARAVGDVLVGAGTVLSLEQVEAAVGAGADFAVAPGSNDVVIGRCLEVGLPFFPGVATPTEIEHARALGLGVVKVFPAAQLGGPGFLRAVAAVYPDVGLIPTGGVTAANLRDYLDVPSVVACGGSWLVPGDLVESRSYRQISERAAEALAL
jgi:2-dehydro-3-deoxyphosphogluconate aldolase/(4S)-4-hydroxy-2-oxoglutarate aldolase